MISDELNRPEVTRLKAREADISQEKRAAKSDGVATCDERRTIYCQKYDGQERLPRAVLR